MRQPRKYIGRRTAKKGVKERNLSIAAVLRKRLRSRARSYGAWLSIGHPEIASIFAAAKGHFVGIDLEHSTIELSTAQMIIRVCHEYARPCLPRIFPDDLEQARRLLDAGADGLIAPQVSAREQIDAIVEVMRYPPVGKRGFGVAAAHEYGRRFEEYVQVANESLSLMIQVETMAGVENIESLASHPGVDAIMVGPYDLSGSLGIPGRLRDRRVVEACNTIIQACKRHGISCGMHLVYPDREEMRRHFAQGFTFLILGSDIFNLCKRSEEIDEMVDDLGNS